MIYSKDNYIFFKYIYVVGCFCFCFFVIKMDDFLVNKMYNVCRMCM